jgi:hypothetical protein
MVDPLNAPKIRRKIPTFTRKSITVHQPYDNVKRDWQLVAIETVMEGDLIAGKGLVHAKACIVADAGDYLEFKVGEDPVQTYRPESLHTEVLAFTRVRTG